MACPLKMKMDDIQPASPPSSSDAEDIHAALNGGEQAYARLVARYEAQIFVQMRRFTRDPRMLRELVQDVFVEAYLSLGNFRGGAFGSWLRTVATRVGYRYWKRENRMRQRRELLAREWPHAEFVVPREPSAAAEVLFHMLERLSPRDRLVLTLHYFDQCSAREIAERTGWSRVLVRVQLHRAIERLRRMLVKAGYGGETGL